MRRNPVWLPLVISAVIAGVIGVWSGVVSGDIWERVKAQQWYSLSGAIGLLVLLLAISIVVLIWQQRTEKEKNGDDGARLSFIASASFRREFLDKIEMQRVHDRLHQGLRNAIRVDLKLTETIAAVRPQLRVYTTEESEQPDGLRTDGNIVDIFRAANGSLLILGEPGTGKTNLLMELAKGLIAEARHDHAAPMPVVFNLARWTLGRRVRTFSEWMADDLSDPAQYGLSRATAETLVRKNLITPLLDGLDEVAQERRAECVQAIHEYQGERDLGKIAVCCRSVEYASLPKLNLRTAVRIEKLIREDVERYLSMDRLRRVGRALQEDRELLKVIDTPLWLHVAMLAAETESAFVDQALPPRDRLYARFVRYALGRKEEGPQKHRTAEQDFTRWIGWLAATMKERNQSQFSLEELNYSWVHSHGRARLIRILVNCLMGGVVFAPVMGIRAGLVLGLIVGLTAPWATLKQPVDELHLNRQKWKEGVASGLVGASVGGVFGGLFGGLGAGLVGGVSLGFATLLNVILEQKPLAARALPNSGTARSLRYAAVVLAMGAALAAAVTLSLRGELRSATLSCIALITGLLGYEKGGMFVADHYSVRLLLSWSGAAPLRYVRFLTEAVERLFILRSGGSYEFLHLTFRDYLADTHGWTGNRGRMGISGKTRIERYRSVG